MLFVERSNRTEILFDGLAERLARPGRDPLARSIVVVQGAGMERWIAQRLAQKHGVCANVEFPFPRPFLERIFAALPPAKVEAAASAREGAWDLDRMTWAIAQAIDARGADGELAPLARHLQGRDADWRLVQLAHQIANVFDQYITYRPEWVLAWEGTVSAPRDLPTGPDADWQRTLFRALCTRLGPGHIAHRATDFLAALGLMPAPTAAASADERIDRRRLESDLRRRFPDAVEIFAVSTLPRLHLEVVNGLARVVDVHLSILAPSRVWYADLWRELRDGDAAIVGSGDAMRGPDVSAHTTPGPVAGWLAGLGRLGAGFQQILVESAAPDGGEHERFEKPGAKRAVPTLLERWQARLLDLDDAEGIGPGSDPSGSGAARIVARDDDSIRVHLCHGPRRELEVVEAVLRSAFAADETLRPEDVIVMAPDIDAIASDVDAVFGSEAEGLGAIPYRIADRGAFRRSPVADAFRALLALLGTRMARSAVFDWLALEPVATRFGLDEQAVERLAEWAERAGVRFGLDEVQRSALGLPAERGHTLAGGLDRLVLAHALGDVPDVVEGRTPVALDAFAEASWLGALGEVETLLASAVRELRDAKTVPEWTRWLDALIARTLARNDANSHEHGALLAVLERLRDAAQSTAFDRPIPFEAIRERVMRTLEETPAPQAFLAGGVTFCQLVPLRAIPFRVVVVTGLVDGAFPRSRAAIGFDAMARAPRPGDRSLRDDDRHLFLEAILSARDRLVLTVPAHDLRSGEPMPPSIVVAELLDALSASFTLAAGEADANADPDPEAVRRGGLRDWLVVRQPLQASSPRHFTAERDPRLASPGERAFRAAQARAEAVRPIRRFLVTPASPEAAPQPTLAGTGAMADAPTLTLDELIERVLRSTRHFAREIVGLALPRPEATADDLDPIALDPLAKSGVGQALFDALVADVGWDEAVARLRADPSLAVDHAGELDARALAAEVRAIAAIAAERRRGNPLPDRSFELEVPMAGARSGSAPAPTLRLVGRLDGLFAHARVEAAYARLGGRREAALWIRHLVLCALRERGEPGPETSVLIGRPMRGDKAGRRVVTFGRVDEPMAMLSMLVGWACAAAETPLPLFERTSRVFALAAMKSGADPARAWRDALGEFEGRDDFAQRQPESKQELETLRVWEGLSPIAPADEAGLPLGFDVLAHAFFEPLETAAVRVVR